MAADYEIDAQGRARVADPRKAPPPITSTPMMGRTAVAKGKIALPLDIETVLDWKSTDVGTEEMAIRVGIIRPPRQPAFTGLQFPDVYVGALSLPQIKFIIDYGVDGFSETIIVDAFPEQSFVLPASFIRIQVLNISNPASAHPDINAFAVVTRASSKPSQNGVRHSKTSEIVAPAGSTADNIQPYCRRLFVSRNSQANTMGAITIRFGSATGAIQNMSFAAGVLVPTLDLPGDVVRVDVTNDEVALNQSITITQILEP